MEKLKNTARWILLLPGAILLGFLATFPLHWLLMLASFFKTKESDILSFNFFVEILGGTKATEALIYPSVIAGVFVYAGYKIAPRFKFYTALILFGLYAGSWILMHILVLTKSLNIPISIDIWRSVITILGACVGLYAAWNHSKSLK